MKKPKDVKPWEKILLIFVALPYGRKIQIYAMYILVFGRTEEKIQIYETGC
jgi:hypothetical protein